MERKYRILGIAPYENLKNAMVTEAAKYEDIEMVVYTGNLEDGAQLALQHMNEGFDILISRGGTAELIRKIASIPVIEITLSINDILRAILLVGNLTEAYAVVGYPTVTQPAHVLCEMMNYRMNIITIHSPDELDPVLKELKAGGCNFILCDVITEMMAREAGVEPILILSGPESIDIAIDYSINMCRVLAETKARSRLFTRALDMQGMKTVIMKQDGSILFSTYNEKNISSVTGYLKKLAESPHSMSAKAFHMIENRLYSISAEETTFLEEPCYIFCLEQNPFPVGGSKHGIRFSTCTEVSVMYSSSFYSLTSSARLMEEKIRMINQTTLPVMILGERGSGKTSWPPNSIWRAPCRDILISPSTARCLTSGRGTISSAITIRPSTTRTTPFLSATSRHCPDISRSSYCPFWWTQMPTSGIELFSPAPKHWIGTCRIRPETLSTICPAPPSTCRRFGN